jgi:hypothetical protein
MTVRPSWWLLVVRWRDGTPQGGSERLVLHKNTVRYRIRKAEESLGHTAGENHRDVELALPYTMSGHIARRYLASGLAGRADREQPHLSGALYR